MRYITFLLFTIFLIFPTSVLACGVWCFDRDDRGKYKPYFKGDYLQSMKNAPLLFVGESTLRPDQCKGGYCRAALKVKKPLRGVEEKMYRVKMRSGGAGRCYNNVFEEGYDFLVFGTPHSFDSIWKRDYVEVDHCAYLPMNSIEQFPEVKGYIESFEVK